MNTKCAEIKLKFKCESSMNKKKKFDLVKNFAQELKYNSKQ